MENFTFHAHTEILFGKGRIKELPRVLASLGRNVLLVFGGGSIKKTGLYDELYRLLPDFSIWELSGVQPNPRIDSVRAGVSLCKAHRVDVVLAVGGGSVIDCAKAIAGGSMVDADPWELVLDPQKINGALPVVTVLTLAATGSEMNKNAVISNTDTCQKLGTASPSFIPAASILDPTYTYTVSRAQTAAGTADIMSHVFENYFKETQDAFVPDRFAEGILKACIRYAPIALEEPAHYEARANLMWASTTALNGLCGAGKAGVWVCHPIEHELSAFYDITHGVGLAIITPRWMRYTLNERTVPKLADYAANVWGLARGDDLYALAEAGIDQTEQFFKALGIPMTLTALGIDDTKFEEMARAAVQNGNLNQAFVPLDTADVIEILRRCL